MAFPLTICLFELMIIITTPASSPTHPYVWMSSAFSNSPKSAFQEPDYRWQTS